MSERKMMGAVLAGTCLALAACGGDDRGPDSMSSAEDIRDALSGTDWECREWEDHSDTSRGNVANWGCMTADNGLVKIQDNADTQGWEDLRMEDGVLPEWAIRVGHFGLDCYAKPQEKCGELADILGA